MSNNLHKYHNLINDLQTYLINRNENMFNLETNLNYNSKKSHFSISVGLDFLSYDHNSLYQNNLYTANKKHIFPKVNGYYSKEFSKKLRLYSSFSYNASLPQAFQLLPFEIQVLQFEIQLLQLEIQLMCLLKLNF
jgi:hypothetical protein